MITITCDVCSVVYSNPESLQTDMGGLSTDGNSIVRTVMEKLPFGSTTGCSGPSSFSCCFCGQEYVQQRKYMSRYSGYV